MTTPTNILSAFHVVTVNKYSFGASVNAISQSLTEISTKQKTKTE